MDSFGDQLRRERERRQTTLDEVAASTRIDAIYLEALERNEFESLPGPRGFGKLYIRAYADLLGFDPRPLLDAFEAEHARRLEPVTDGLPDGKRKRRIRFRPSEPQPESEAEAQPAPGPAPAAQPATAPEPESRPVPEPRPTTVELTPEPIAPEPDREAVGPQRESRRLLPFAIAAAALLAVIAFVMLRPSSESEAPTASAAVGDPVAVTPPPIVQSESEPAEPTPTPRPEPAVPTGLHASDFGVGTAVVDRRLIGEGRRFEEGSVVAFWTRVVGGKPGERVSHVWLRNGGRVQTIELELGSAAWRTHSTKTLWGRGPWAVELRAADGRVLARSEFECAAPGS